MPPTIHDVAKRAGVSISTVSRVLNDSAIVHEAKHARVLEAVQALGYSPNPAALSLLGQRAGGIGVLLPYVAGDFFSEFLRGIDQFTSDRGLFLMVSSSHRSVKEFKASLQSFHGRVDGLIVMSTEAPARVVRGWAPEGLPLVFVNTEVEGTDIAAVNADNRGGAFRLTEHLIAQGHQRIGFLRGSEGAHDAAERLAGYRAALAAHGLAPALELPGDYTMASGEAAVPLLLTADPLPTAVFAANDDSAYGLLTGLREAGLRIPEDIALAGFDDAKLSQLAIPSLTSVRVPVREMGRAAIKQLSDLIDGRPGTAERTTVLPTEVVVRQSTA